jgi:hypothetical protein
VKKPPTSTARKAHICNPLGRWKLGQPRNTWKSSTETEVRALDPSWSDVEARAKDKRVWRKLVVDLFSNWGPTVK